MVETKLYTSPKAIRGVIESMHALDNDENSPGEYKVTVEFKPITSPVWRTIDRLSDAADAGIEPTILHRIVAGKPVKMNASTLDSCEGCLQLTLPESGSDCIEVGPQHLESLEMVPLPKQVEPPDVHKIDGCRYDLRFMDNGELKIGCQTITSKGQLQAFKLLAAKLGYDLSE